MTKDISAFTAMVIMVCFPLIGLAYFVLFPVVGTIIVIKELINVVARKRYLCLR